MGAWKCNFSPFLRNYERPTDQSTDRLTDRPIDQPTNQQTHGHHFRVSEQGNCRITALSEAPRLRNTNILYYIYVIYMYML